MIRIYTFESQRYSLLGRTFQVAATGPGQARIRATRLAGHADVKRIGEGEDTGLSQLYAIRLVGGVYHVAIDGRHVGFAHTSMDALACAVAHDRNRNRMLPDGALMGYQVGELNRDVAAGRATWADSRRYAELWNKYKLSTVATSVGGVVCIADREP